MAGFLVCAFSSILLCAQGPLWIGVCARFCTVVVVYWVKPQMMEFIFLCGCWFLGESPSQQAPGRKARGGGGGGGNVVGLVQAPAKTRMSRRFLVFQSI